MPSPMQTALIWVGFVAFVLLASRVTYYLLGWSNKRRLNEKAANYQRLMASWSQAGKKKRVIVEQKTLDDKSFSPP